MSEKSQENRDMKMLLVSFFMSQHPVRENVLDNPPEMNENVPSCPQLI